MVMLPHHRRTGVVAIKVVREDVIKGYELTAVKYYLDTTVDILCKRTLSQEYRQRFIYSRVFSYIVKVR